MYQGENFSGSAEDFVMQRKISQEGVHVYAETGLTPRQLLKQRAELLDALKLAKQGLDVAASDQSDNFLAYVLAGDKASLAIRNAEA